jgi:hypothetical protein
MVSGKNVPEDAPQLCRRERTRVGGRTATDGKQAASALLWLSLRILERYRPMDNGCDTSQKGKNRSQ